MVIDGALFFERWDARAKQSNVSEREESSRTFRIFSSPLRFLFLTSKQKQEELATGEDVARCPSCSLHLHVVFNPGEFEERERFFPFFFRSFFFDLCFLLTSSHSFPKRQQQPTLPSSSRGPPSSLPPMEAPTRPFRSHE